MEQSTEIGWIITDKGHDHYTGPILNKSVDDLTIADAINEEGDELCIETHPHDPSIVFVSFWMDLSHGFPLDGVLEPRGQSAEVHDFVKKIDPKAEVKFGIIQTRR